MIDRLRKSDTFSVIEIAREANIFSPAELIALRHRMSVYLDGYPDWFIVSKEKDAIIGFVSFGMMLAQPDSWEIFWLCVEVKQQGNHKATELLNAVEKICHQAQARNLYVETEDTPCYASARSFYERQGFVRVALINDFYAEGKSKIIYRKGL